MTQFKHLRPIAFSTVMLILGFGLRDAVRAEFHFGATGGATIGHLSDGGEFDKIKLGGGASLEWSLGPRMGVRSGLYWSPKGSRYEPTYAYPISQALRLNTVAVPVGLTYRHWPKSRLPLLVYGAVEWSYLVSARRFENDDTNLGESTEADVADSIRRWDVAPLVGVGICASDGVELAVQHSWGLRSVEKGSTLMNRSFWVLGTLWFDVK